MSSITHSPLERAKAHLIIPDVAARLFPGWRAAPSCKSPFRQDRNASFSVFDDGRKWKDHATGEYGDIVDFIAKARGISKCDAAHELIAMAGAQGPVASRPVAVERKKTADAAPSLPLAPMSAQCSAIWDEGVEHLLTNAGHQDSIDKWRGWPPGTARKLAEDGLMGVTLIGGKRGVGFAVQAPYRDELGLVSTRDIGFHHRHKPTAAGERASWKFLPNQKEHGVSCPALPFVMGGGFLPYASTIVVVEGQWDAITLAAGAGWLVSDSAWPEHVSVFGIRGAGSWRSLIDAWSTFWPKSARFVLIQDADKGGDSWKAPGGFIETLQKLGHHVRLLRPSEDGAKDINDIHRAHPLTPEIVAQWISSDGRTLQ